MKIKEAIILAGGLGTRLRSAVPDLPKCMAPVAGKPFLFHLIKYYTQQGIEKFIFSLGYKHEIIEQFLDKEFPELNKQYVIEKEPLGTGGAIQLACSKASEETVLILNGDTIFKINLEEVASFHHSHNADCTLSLKPMTNFDRYGVVELNDDHSIKSFKEKQFYEEGLINGGVYVLNTASFLNQDLPDKFSFEKNYLEKQHARTRHGAFLQGIIQEGYFIDIGIPEDFTRAQKELLNL